MNMKLIRNILIALCLCCISCGNSSATSNNDNGLMNEQIQKNKERITSIEEGFEKLNEKLNETLKNQEESIKIAKNSRDKWVFYSWLTVVTGIIIWLVYCWNKTAEKKDQEFLRREIMDIKNRLDSMKSQYVNRKNGDDSNLKVLQKIQDLSNRLDKLESKYLNTDTPKKNPVKVPSFINPYEKNKEDKHAQKRYFGNVKGDGIFNDVYNSMQDEAKFVVWFSENNEEAEFDIIELSRIRSFDGIEKAVDYRGNELTLQSASSFITVEKGLVRQNGSGIWKIERKVKIELK